MKLLNSKKNPDKICELIYDGTPIGSCEDIIWNFLSNSEEKIELKKVKIDASAGIVIDIAVRVIAVLVLGPVSMGRRVGRWAALPFIATAFNLWFGSVPPLD